MLNLRPHARYIQFGIELGVSMVFPILLGYWIDARYGTSPWFLLGGIFMGLITSAWAVFKMAVDSNRETQARKDAKKRQSGNDPEAGP